MGKYAYQTQTLVQGRRQLRLGAADGRSSVERRTGCLTRWCGAAVSIESLSYRLSFTTDRFARHAPRWQFVIWGRQFALTAIMLLPDLLGPSEHTIDK